MRDLHLQTLGERRRELVERSTTQRAALVANVAPLASKAATLERAVAAVRSHPVLAAGLAAGVALLGGRRLFGLVTRAVTLYMLVRKL